MNAPTSNYIGMDGKLHPQATTWQIVQALEIIHELIVAGHQTAALEVVDVLIERVMTDAAMVERVYHFEKDVYEVCQ